ncbi:MAG TPA: hypothetical protein VK994_00930, partial [Bacteroidales bacterium]|nr:hypothetical protein [Bacteroidales bacterium]
TVHSDLQQYRYDFVDNSKQGAVIVDPAANTSAIMLPDEKKVLYTAADGFISASNDPVQAYNSYRKQGTEKLVGHESIMGYDCIKKSIYDKEGTLMFTTWFSEELNFPLKMMGHWDEFTYMYLENIKGWSPDPAYFKVPKDYSKVDEGANP